MGTHTRILRALVLAAMISLSLPAFSTPATSYEGHAVVGANGFPRTVMMELFTATWCGPCKIADPAADDVLENHSADAQLVRYHFEDSLMTPEGRSRAYDEYGVDGVPYMFVDGVLKKQGLNTLQDPMREALENYTDFVERRLGVQSPMAIIASSEVTATDVSVRATVAPASSIRGHEVRLQAIIHESHVLADGLINDAVTRAIQSTTFVASDGPFTQEFTFPLNASWVQEELGVIVFAQDGVAGEVHQTAGSSLGDSERPAVVITSHEDGATVTDNPIILQGFAVSGMTVQSVEVRVDAGMWETADGTGEWAYEVSGLAAGPHTVEARAFDGVKYSDVHQVTVEVRESTGGGLIPSWGIIAASLIAAGAVVALLLIRRRRHG